MRTYRLLLLALGFALLLSLDFFRPQPAQAANYSEGATDAGNTWTTARLTDVLDPLSSISGVLSSGTDVDIYAFRVTGTTAFSASTVGGSSFDTQLFLFGSDTVPVVMNDNANVSTSQSTITPITLTAGEYFLVITAYDVDLWVGGFPSYFEIFADLPRTSQILPIASVPIGTINAANWQGTAASSGGAYTITLTGTLDILNDAPANFVPGGTANVTVGGTRTFGYATFNPIGFTDADALGGTMRVTLSAERGTLTIPNRAGLSFVGGDGVGDSLMTFTGTTTVINQRLDGLIYQSPNTAGADSITILTNDNGNTGQGGTLTDIDQAFLNIVTAPSNVNLITNGTFDAGIANWGFWNSTQDTSSGALSIVRNPGSPDGGFFQFIAQGIPQGEFVELKLNLSNTSAQPRTVNMVLRTTDWSDSRSCFFTAPPNSPNFVYRMGVAPSRAWNPIVLQGWLQNADGLPGLRIDNLDLRYYQGVSLLSEFCQTEPPSGTNLIFDGGFNSGLANFATFGSPAAQVAGGALELWRWAGATGDAGIFQFSPYNAPSGGTFQYTFRLGNRGSTFKTAVMVVRNVDWSNNRVCYIGVPPGRPLTSLTMRLRATTNWQNIIVQIFVPQTDGVAALLVDDLNLQYVPGLTVSGANVECPTFPLEEGVPVDANTTLPPALPAEGGIAPIEAAKP